MSISRWWMEFILKWMHCLLLPSQLHFHRDGWAIADRHQAYDTFKQFGNVGRSCLAWIQHRFQVRFILSGLQRLCTIGEPHHCRVPNKGWLYELAIIRRSYLTPHKRAIDQSINWMVDCVFPVFWQERILRGFDRGKFSFPVVHPTRADESNRQVISSNARNLLSSQTSYWRSCSYLWKYVDVLQKRPPTPTTKRYIVGFMDKATSSLAYMYSLSLCSSRESGVCGGGEAGRKQETERKYWDSCMWKSHHHHHQRRRTELLLASMDSDMSRLLWKMECICIWGILWF